MTEQTDNQQYKDTRSLAIKVGSLIYNEKHVKGFSLSKFKSADLTAHEMDKLFGVESIVSGHEILRAVQKDRVGQSPLRAGRPSRIPDEEFKLVTQLVWTKASIDQGNASPHRLNRKEMESLVGKLVNAKLKQDGASPLNEGKFYKRIEVANSAKIGIKVVDKREELRFKWLSYHNLLAQHVNWEKFMVESGMARLPESEEEKESEGFIVYLDGFLRNILLMDEMPFSLDGSTNGIGGRVAMVPSNGAMNESGKAAYKTDGKSTFLFGMTAAAEALPPFLIVRSKAKIPRFRAEMIVDMHQVEGQFGWPRRIKADSMIAASASGGMNAALFSECLESYRSRLYPMARDAQGYRVVVKSDMGPGRMNWPKFLIPQRNSGLIMYPGLPNGTELDQEMDQQYSDTKTCMEMNRLKLEGARRDCERNVPGYMTKHSDTDLPKILFGGDIALPDGSTITLENAFEKSFTPEKIKSALAKCGYFPATRQSLGAKKLRREWTGEDIDDSPGADLDRGHDEMLADIQSLNHATVDKLVELGYEVASEFKCYIRKNPSLASIFSPSIKTVPLSTVPKDVVEKLLSVRTAGKWFSVTGGGGPLNCTEMLQIQHLKANRIKAKKLRKRKEDLEKKAVIVSTAQDLLQTNSQAEWKVSDYKTLVSSKTASKKTVNGVKKAELIKTWDKLKDKPFIKSTWDNKYTKLLEKLESDELEPFDTTKADIYRTANKQLVQRLRMNLGSLPMKRALKVIGGVYNDAGEEDRAVMTEYFQSIIENGSSGGLDQDFDDDNSNLSVYSNTVIDELDTFLDMDKSTDKIETESNSPSNSVVNDTHDLLELDYDSSSHFDSASFDSQQDLMSEGDSNDEISSDGLEMLDIGKDSTDIILTFPFEISQGELDSVLPSLSISETDDKTIPKEKSILTCHQTSIVTIRQNVINDLRSNQYLNCDTLDFFMTW